MTVLATAGHVDHGKSTLVRVLTGTDPDRLPEERRRGLTVDLGFASTVLPSGAEVAFVDVPGHVRFLRNMLAGVGSVDTCLFVVSACEGWRQQSEEHLRILDLLGTRGGLVALTKVGLVDDETVETIALEIRERAAGTFLAGADPVAVDAVEGIGLDALRTALDELVRSVPPAPDLGRARLWIDRAFSIRGAGTVVTGTLTGGCVAVDDEVLVLPSGRQARVRSVQTLNRRVDRVGPGRRVALNLAGIDRDSVGRGDVVVHPGVWHLTDRFDASLRVLDDFDHEVSHRGAHTAFVGTRGVSVSMRVIGGSRIGVGDTGAVRLRLPVAVPLLPGDRFVLRDEGRSRTVGGGEVLDVEPLLPASRARPDRDVARVVAERGWVEASRLRRLVGLEVTPTVGCWVVHPPLLEQVRSDLRAAVADAGPIGLDLAGLDERHRAVVEGLEDVEVRGGRAVELGSPDPIPLHPHLSALRASPFSPPPPGDLDRALLGEMLRRGLVVDAGGLYFCASAVQQAAEVIREMLRCRPGGVTVGELRDELGTSRRFAVALLEYMDATGRTRRVGDARVAGPRL